MKHHKNIRKFGREKNQRKALLTSLSVALIRHGKIETTEAKAKELRPKIEKLVTEARKGTLASYRSVLSSLRNQNDEAKRLVNDIAPRFKERAGGYTRITKLGERQGDAAKLAIIEFVQ